MGWIVDVCRTSQKELNTLDTYSVTAFGYHADLNDTFDIFGFSGATCYRIHRKDDVDIQSSFFFFSLRFIGT